MIKQLVLEERRMDPESHVRNLSPSGGEKLCEDEASALARRGGY